MKKSTKIFAAAFAVILTAVMCVSLGIGFITLNKVSFLEANAEHSDTAKENGVLIANRYEVKSTEQISDAYKKGDDSSLSDTDKKAYKAASDVLKDIIKKDMTDYEKELAVYEWIQKNIHHDDDMLVIVQDPDSDTYTPLGVLSGKKAVCVGFATTFRLFMQMLDIDCKVVHDVDLGHSWDLVKIGSGWYHVDLYYDTPNSKFSHFNLTDNMRSDDYTWDESLYPAANSYEYCYAVMQAESIDDPFAIPQKLKDAIKDKRPFFSYKMTDSSSLEKAEMRVMLDQISETVFGTDQYENYYFSYNTILNGKDYIAYASIVYPSSEEDDSQVTEEIQEKIRKKINKVFGSLEPAMEPQIGEAATTEIIR